MKPNLVWPSCPNKFTDINLQTNVNILRSKSNQGCSGCRQTIPEWEIPMQKYFNMLSEKVLLVISFDLLL